MNNLNYLVETSDISLQDKLASEGCEFIILHNALSERVTSLNSDVPNGHTYHPGEVIHT